MPRVPIVRLDESGSITIPARLRRGFPPNCEFEVKREGNTIVLTKLGEPEKPRRDREAVAKYLAVCKRIARHFNEQGITLADIRRAVKRARTDKRAEGSVQ